MKVNAQRSTKRLQQDAASKYYGISIIPQKQKDGTKKYKE